VVALERVADLLALAVAQEALQPHVDHHVVADEAARHEVLAQRHGSARNEGAARVAALGSTHVHGLPDLKRAMHERHGGVHEGLLHAHRAATDRAALRRLAHCNADSLQPQHLVPAALLEGAGMLSQRRERGGGGSAVFFPASSPCWA